MKRALISGVLAGVSSVCLAQDQGPMTLPGSLFNAAAGDGVLVNRVAMHKGDILTIIVIEQATGSTTSSTSSAKQDSTAVNQSVLPALTSITGLLGGSLGNILNSPFKGASTGVNSATSGTGTSSTSTSYTNNVSVIVKEVLPNGNLLIEGKRTIAMNKQTQTFTLEGTVRRDDISVTNTINSNQIADLKLIADGKGLIADRQRQGILTKLLSWIF